MGTAPCAVPAVRTDRRRVAANGAAGAERGQQRRASAAEAEDAEVLIAQTRDVIIARSREYLRRNRITNLLALSCYHSTRVLT